MAFWSSKSDEEKAAAAAQQARHAINGMRLKISRAFQAEQWGEVDSLSLQMQKLLRERSAQAPVSQSLLAEVVARWGLAQYEQRRFEESVEQLARAERLFNMENAEAAGWAASRDITMEGEGPPLDLRLALRSLRVLSELLVRHGDPRSGAVLDEVVGVADMLQDDEARWEAREKLAVFTTGLADWPRLLVLAQEMGVIARRQRDLTKLMQALRFFAEGYVGQQQLERARDAQRLVVDIARFLNHPDLTEEETELEKLRAMRV